jgi:hypothetical protein
LSVGAETKSFVSTTLPRGPHIPSHLAGDTFCIGIAGRDVRGYRFPCMVASGAHSFGQFKKHALFKARTQSPCFSYPGLMRAFISAGSADLSSFGGVGVGWPPDLPCWLPVYDERKCGRFIC